MSQASLVDAVKNVQRQEGGRDFWVNYVDQYGGGGKHDPALRDVWFLKEFLQYASSSGYQTSAGPSKGYGKSSGYDKGYDKGYGKGYAKDAGKGKGKGGGDEMQMMMNKMRQMMDMMESMQKGGGKGMMGKGGAKGGKDDKPKTERYPAQSAEHASAIAKVKHIQKAEGGKESWSAFVDGIGSTHKDPGAHPVEILESFLAEVDPGGNQTWSVKGNFDEAAFLANKVKTGQKQSEEFKNAWYEYVLQYGEDKRDPTRHPAEFLRYFLDTAPAIGDSDPEHPDLVRQVKDYQRTSEEGKQQWWTYCASYGEGKNDPLKHSADFLRGFLQGASAPPASGGKGKGSKWIRASPY